MSEVDESVQNFYVVGWFDGRGVCTFCINFAHAMNEYNRYKGQFSKANKWFLELNMMMRYNYIDKNNNMAYRYIGNQTIRSEGTYESFMAETDRIADEKTKLLFEGEKNGPE